MGTLTQLNVVNDMLGSLGEAEVNSLVGQAPLISRCVSLLRTANAREQTKGWWFNTETLTLTPDNSGAVVVSADALKVDPIDPNLPYTHRGNRLYNLKAGTEDPRVFTYPVEVRLVRLIDFEDLPAAAQFAVSYAAQIEFHGGVDGDSDKVALLTRAYRQAALDLSAEHIRAVGANLLNNPSTRASLNALSGFGRLRPLTIR